MKEVDYTQIANDYDKSKTRHFIVKDLLIDQLLKKNKEIRILDLGCGTGNYLRAQMNYFKSDSIKWFGLDKSDSMLTIAKDKLNGKITLTQSNAEILPYQKNYFDYVICNQAYHHFISKKSAFAEVYRVLRQNGIFYINSIYPFLMKNSWVYNYFPKIYDKDRKRFWKKDKIFNFLEVLGFDVKLEVRTYLIRRKLDLILEEALLKNYSQLYLIKESEYQEGVQNIKKEISKNESKAFSLSKKYIICSKI